MYDRTDCSCSSYCMSDLLLGRVIKYLHICSPINNKDKTNAKVDAEASKPESRDDDKSAADLRLLTFRFPLIRPF